MFHSECLRLIEELLLRGLFALLPDYMLVIISQPLALIWLWFLECSNLCSKQTDQFLVDAAYRHILFCCFNLYAFWNFDVYGVRESKFQFKRICLDCGTKTNADDEQFILISLGNTDNNIIQMTAIGAK